MSIDVLLVDDSPVTRKMVRRALRMCGLEIGSVTEAGNGAEALAAIARQPVHLVVADLNMPVMDGGALVERMASDPSLAHIPIIVVAARTGDERIERLLSCGVRGYLPKPFRPEALRALVQQVVGGAAHA